jgi:hypothetical protein
MSKEVSPVLVANYTLHLKYLFVPEAFNPALLATLPASTAIKLKQLHPDAAGISNKQTQQKPTRN